MARRHNTFSQLLGSVENDLQPLVGSVPMSGVPDLANMADSIEQDAQYHADNMKRHANTIRRFSALQSQFEDAGGEF